MMIRACHVDTHECSSPAVSSNLSNGMQTINRPDVQDSPTSGKVSLNWLFSQSLLLEHVRRGLARVVRFESERIQVHDNQGVSLALVMNKAVHARVYVTTTCKDHDLFIDSLYFYCNHAKMILDEQQKMHKTPGRAGTFWVGGPLQCQIRRRSSSRLRDVTVHDLLVWFQQGAFMLHSSFCLTSKEYEA